MSVKVNFNEKRFNRIMDSYLKYSGRSFTNEVNKRTFNIALKSASKTPRVQKTEIRKELRAAADVQPVAPKTRRKAKAGQRRKPRRKVPLMAILINYNRGKRGKGGLWGDVMRKQVNRHLQYRYKGMGFMAAAWLGIAHDVGNYVKPRRTVRGRRTNTTIGNFKGEGKPEKRIGALKPTARGYHGAKAGAQVSGVRRAMKLALNAESRDMLKYLRRKIPKDISTLDRNNAAQAIAARKL